jgi:hypothetical protein
MDQAFVDFLFERLVFLFKFRKMRLHRHAACLLNQWLSYEVSLAQTQCKCEAKLAFAIRQMEPKALDCEAFFSSA